jgi:hypothetical protein
MKHPWETDWQAFLRQLLYDVLTCLIAYCRAVVEWAKKHEKRLQDEYEADLAERERRKQEKKNKRHENNNHDHGAVRCAGHPAGIQGAKDAKDASQP